MSLSKCLNGLHIKFSRTLYSHMVLLVAACLISKFIINIVKDNHENVSLVLIFKNLLETLNLHTRHICMYIS